MSNLSDLIPAGGGQNNTDFTASGAIAAGKPVILNSAGTVTQVAETANGAAGTPANFESATTERTSSTFDSNSNKVVTVYKDMGNGAGYGTAVVGTVSGNTISYGTPVVFQTATVQFPVVTFDSTNNKVVISYYYHTGSANIGYAIVGTVSGTSISFGSRVALGSSAISTWASITYDTNANRVVISYRDSNNSDYGTSVVGTVSGTAISFGTPVVYEAANAGYTSSTFDSNSNKVVIAYQDYPNSQYGTAIVGTVSGTSISFGTAVVYESAASSYIAATFDSNSNKVVIAYEDVGNSSSGTAVVGTVSGTAISFGTAVVFNSGESRWNAITFDSNNNVVVVCFRDGSDGANKGKSYIGTVSGTSISFGSIFTFEDGSTTDLSTTFDSDSNKVVSAYRDNHDSDYGKGVVISTTTSNLTSTNLLGVSSAAISNSASGTINTWGSINEVQSGLTIGSDYYAQSDGTISTTSTSPAQLLGKAISATQINIKDYTG